MPRPTATTTNFFTVMTELPTQNDLGEVQRVCGPVAALSALSRSPVGYEYVRTPSDYRSVAASWPQAPSIS